LCGQVKPSNFPGDQHHITQRGNQRENVFFTEEDRTGSLDWMKEYCGKHRVEILAYRLMTNPIHLVVAENKEGLQRVMKPLHMPGESKNGVEGGRIPLV
jgi:putative transposase